MKSLRAQSVPALTADEDPILEEVGREGMRILNVQLGRDIAATPWHMCRG